MFLLKVKFLMVSQEEGIDRKPMVKCKVRSDFQDSPAQRMNLHFESEETQGKKLIPSRMW